MNLTRSFLSLLLPLLVGCGSEDPSKDQADASANISTGPLLPWATGNSWTYQVTQAGEISTKVTTLGDEEPVGGSGPNSEALALKVVTTKASGADETVSWQALQGDKVLRYREQSFSASTDELELEEHWDPYKLHVDWSAEHTALDATWLEEYEETKLPVGQTVVTESRHDRWVVIAVGEEVVVPAGTFSDTVVLQKLGGSTTKTYWYARGVGKLKETGDQTEELVEYELEE